MIFVYVPIEILYVNNYAISQTECYLSHTYLYIHFTLTYIYTHIYIIA